MNFTMQSIFGICFGGALAGCLFALVGLRLLAVLQQAGYSGARFLKWYFSKGNLQRRRLSLLTIALLLLTALFCLCFSFAGTPAAELISAIPFVGILALYLVSEKRYALKVPANRTPRFLRLFSALLILSVLLSVGVCFLLSCLSALGIEWISLFKFVPVCLLPLLLPLAVICANALMGLYELPRNRRYVKKAGERLRQSKCLKVGITGSFGKTSVKHFCAQMLSTGRKVVSTPASYNTPMGIAKTVFEQGLDCDVFLAEMGARHPGDIEELCDLVQPDFGIVTGVCGQHIETFGSLEAIKREKSVLAARAKFCVLGETVKDFEGNGLREGVDFRVDGLVCSKDGISFTLTTKEERIPLQYALLGRSAAEDVALAAMLCRKLGMTWEEIAACDLQPVPHRLQKIEANGRIILDDSYNANISGAKNAVETLRLFEGKKFVVTPGLVELGQLEESLNEELGSCLAGLEVVLVGETLVLPVRKGYLGAGGEEKRLRIVPTLGAAQEILSRELGEGDCVLFLNDLPDIYCK